MITDKNNDELHIGDCILIPCTILQMDETNKLNNLYLEAVYPMQQDRIKTRISMNSRQVLKNNAEKEVEPKSNV